MSGQLLEKKESSILSPVREGRDSAIKKTCTKCKIDKSLDEFDNQAKGKGGKCASCKECRRIQRSEYRAKNRDRLTASQREYNRNHRRERKEWQDRNRDKVRESVLRRKARLAGVETEIIDREELIIRDCGICYLCGLMCDTITIDHIDPISNGGSHTYNNLAIAHPKCNYSKGNKNLLEYLLSV